MRLLTLLIGLSLFVVASPLWAEEAPTPEELKELGDIPYPLPESPLKDLDLSQINTTFTVPKNPDGSELTQEQKKELYYKMLPTLEKMMENINETLADPSMQPWVKLGEVKLYPGKLHLTGMEQDWKVVIEPLIHKYASNNGLAPSKQAVYEYDKNLPIPDVDKEIARMKQIEAKLRSKLQDDSQSLEQMNITAKKLDTLEKALKDMEKLKQTMSEKGDLIKMARIVYSKQKLELQIVYDKITKDHQGTAIETVHGNLDPKALIAFIEEQEKEKKIEFLYPDYRKELFAYISGLSTPKPKGK